MTTKAERTWEHLEGAIEKARSLRGKWADGLFHMAEPEELAALELAASRAMGNVQRIASNLVKQGLKLPRVPK